MEECSLYLDRPFVLLVVGWGCFFVPTTKARILLNKMIAFIFRNRKKSSYKC